MSLSQFKWNKKRKHYAYSHKKRGSKEENILITSKRYIKKHKKGKERVVSENIPLNRHPDKNKHGQFYVIPRNYLDDSTSFDSKVYDWKWDVNDKRKIKRIKKSKNRK